MIRAIIDSKIYISWAALFLTIETQIQLGSHPQWHAYLWIIFFATLFAYNLPRLLAVTTRQSINNRRHGYSQNMATYALIFISIAGLACSIAVAKREVLLALVPLGTLSMLYSIPIIKKRNRFLRLRELPYLKIFIISLTWSASTVLLPVIHDSTFNKNIVYILLERFLFVFSVAILFDIRDMAADKKHGLKTIPLLLNEKNSMTLSYLTLLVFFLICCAHYGNTNSWSILLAMGISALTTLLVFCVKKAKQLPHYYNGVLDGTMLFQGLLVLLFYFLTKTRDL